MDLFLHEMVFLTPCIVLCLHLAFFVIKKSFYQSHIGHIYVIYVVCPRRVLWSLTYPDTSVPKLTFPISEYPDKRGSTVQAIQEIILTPMCSSLCIISNSFSSSTERGTRLEPYTYEYKGTLL